jgi:glucose/arabinose dehydrogenase
LGFVRAGLAALLVVGLVAGCGGGEEATTPTETAGLKPTSTIDESAISGAPVGLERSRPPKVPGVPNRPSEPLFALEPVAENLGEPVYVAAPASEPERLYIVERAGRILVLEDGAVRQEPFLDIRGRVRTEIEEGLHSVAFHPEYGTNRRFYVDYNDKEGDIHVVEFRSDGTRALENTARELLVIDKVEGVRWHNGGQLQFGPDGLLYVSMGDSARNPLDPIPTMRPETADPNNHSQDLSLLFGKLLTIDVDSEEPDIRIAAYGLRNAWRFSFDRENGDLYIADVGQHEWEEIDYLPSGYDGLPNFGWSVYEGVRPYNEDFELGDVGELVWPVLVYPHGSFQYCGERGSVTGGYVYRGTAIPKLRGRYVFGEFCSYEIWSFRIRNGRAVDVRKEPLEVLALVSFGEDANGELYAVDMSNGVVYRLVRPA